MEDIPEYPIGRCEASCMVVRMLPDDKMKDKKQRDLKGKENPRLKYSWKNRL